MNYLDDPNEPDQNIHWSYARSLATFYDMVFNGLIDQAVESIHATSGKENAGQVNHTFTERYIKVWVNYPGFDTQCNIYIPWEKIARACAQIRLEMMLIDDDRISEFVKGVLQK